MIVNFEYPLCPMLNSPGDDCAEMVTDMTIGVVLLNMRSALKSSKNKTMRSLADELDGAIGNYAPDYGTVLEYTPSQICDAWDDLAIGVIDWECIDNRVSNRWDIEIGELIGLPISRGEWHRDCIRAHTSKRVWRKWVRDYVQESWLDAVWRHWGEAWRVYDRPSAWLHDPAEWDAAQRSLALFAGVPYTYMRCDCGQLAMDIAADGDVSHLRKCLANIALDIFEKVMRVYGEAEVRKCLPSQQEIAAAIKKEITK